MRASQIRASVHTAYFWFGLFLKWYQMVWECADDVMLLSVLWARGKSSNMCPANKHLDLRNHPFYSSLFHHLCLSPNNKL